MALYTIGDLHLSLAKNKPMDIFGARWQDHTEKIRRRFSALITDNDTVVLPGDFSWAMTLEEAREDFLFLDSLPGKKILSKGNHDYWWTSLTKIKQYLGKIGVTSIDFLHNNAFFVENCIVCGSRGWFTDQKFQPNDFNSDYTKLVNRECERLKFSLDEGEKLKDGKSVPTVVFLHFPPIYNSFICEPIIKILSDYNVCHVYYGHIHGDYSLPQTQKYGDLIMSLISADYLNFTPQKVFLNEFT